MEIRDYELKKIGGFTTIKDIKHIVIILSKSKIILKKYLTKLRKLKDAESFIESLEEMICLTLTRYVNAKNITEYTITSVVDEDGIGYELKIPKELFYSILKFLISKSKEARKWLIKRN